MQGPGLCCGGLGSRRRQRQRAAEAAHQVSAVGWPWRVHARCAICNCARLVSQICRPAWMSSCPLQLVVPGRCRTAGPERMREAAEPASSDRVPVPGHAAGLCRRLIPPSWRSLRRRRTPACLLVRWPCWPCMPCLLAQPACAAAPVPAAGSRSAQFAVRHSLRTPSLPPCVCSPRTRPNRPHCPRCLPRPARSHAADDYQHAGHAAAPVLPRRDQHRGGEPGAADVLCAHERLHVCQRVDAAQPHAGGVSAVQPARVGARRAGAPRGRAGRCSRWGSCGCSGLLLQRSAAVSGAEGGR